MPKFQVTVRCVIEQTFDIEADDCWDAIAEAEDQFRDEQNVEPTDTHCA